MTAALGSLLLVPNTLDLGAPQAPPIDSVLPAGVLLQAARLSHWVAEDAKTTRAFLKRVDSVVPLARPLQEVQIAELPRTVKGGHTQAAPAPIDALLAPALAGQDIGLLSEAGLPAVADPGALLVACAHRLGIGVRPLAGPSSLLLALAASGLNGQSFAFVGYLPTDTDQRRARVQSLEQRSQRERQTQIAIETPYRNASLMAALLECLQANTHLSVACGLTLPSGWCMTRSVAQWRLTPPRFEDKHLPAVFLWLAP
ncbi:MAG: SAM-dependent methyltransferase [Pseudomonadota bacterium]